MNIRKQVAVYGILGVLIHLFPFTMIHVHAQEHLSIDEEINASFRANKPEYLALSTSLHEPENQYSNQPTETIQAFSFVHKTFRTNVDQPIRVRFTSKLAADQVLIRIPKEGTILTAQLSKGETIQHSHGEYWTLRTPTKQTEFELPVVFDAAGQYFLTIDHDADQFYLEVEELKETIQSENEENTQGAEDPADGEGQLNIEGQASKETHDQRKSTFLDVVEHHLLIPDNLLDLEDARVLEETRDPQNRSTSSVGNWSQFRSAWNSSSTTFINVTSSISAGSASLNERSQSIIIECNLNTVFFEHRDHTLVLAGTANLEVRATGAAGEGGLAGLHTHGNSIISQSGTGTVRITNRANIFGGIIAQNILFQNGGLMTGGRRLDIRNNGSLEILSTDNFMTGIYGRIGMAGNATANIKGSRVVIHGNRWNSADLQLNGPRAGNIVSAITDPDDFALLYANSDLSSNNMVSYLVVNGFSGNVSRPSYSLSLQASPSQGGTPTTQSHTIQQGATTTITANPNSGYNFVHWEIVSGNGSTIESVTSETTTFTMGSQNTTVRAVYEENQAGEVHVYHTDREGHELIEPDILMGTVGEHYQTQPAKIPNYQLVETPDNVTGTFSNEMISVVYVYDIDTVSPIDPLDPDVEVAPENRPELPENQGLLSIDFVSSFTFGSQAISAHDQTYYAQPQRLLNEDGTVNEDEERPNYVQVSDRRSENERNGWQLAVTQKEQFQTETKTELSGAQLQLMNQQLVTAQGGKEPALQATNPLKLVPGNKRTLVRAEGNEGNGTWIYRFGDADTAGQSVALHVPKGATPEAQRYSTTLLWELSAVPGN